MNFSKKNNKDVRQNALEKRKPQKHDANVQQNTTLYFQVGLILVLFLTYGLFELKIQTKTIEISYDAPRDEEPDVYYANQFKVLDNKKSNKNEKRKKQLIVKEPKIIDNDIDMGPDRPNIITQDQNTSDQPFNPGDITVIELPDDTDPVNIIFVQEVPIFPGCEKHKTNAAKRKCMSDKIGKHVKRKFDASIASKLGLEGRQRINVMFKIDKNGNISKIEASAKHPALITEAERVINKLPKMIAGKQDGRAVEVLYSLPILFKVQY